MNGKNKTVPFALVGVLIAAAIIGGVTVLQQQGIFGWNTTSGILGQKGTLAAQITDPPNLPAGVSNVYISYTDIKVHVADAGNQSGWYTVAQSGQINLTSVLNIRETLGSASVPSGDFNLVTFDIANATVTYNGVNYTAYVPANKITVPIADGGVQAQSGSSTGFVIDVSPTVVPYQNGTGISFVLVPGATSIPVPPLNWHAGDDQQGARENLSDDSWWHQNEAALMGNLTIQSVTLTNSSLSITLKNTGTNNITLNAISILGNTSLIQMTVSHDSTSTTASDYATSTTNTASTTQTSTITETHASTTASTAEGSDYEQEFMTVASFQVLSNGTLVQPNNGLEIEDHMIGLVIQSGQSVTLTFSGQILTIHDDISLSSITPGQVYHIAALSEFDTRAYANVTATA